MGEWCLFVRSSDEHQDEEMEQYLIGYICEFAYMEIGTKTGTAFSNRFAMIDGNKKFIGAYCEWFTMGDGGIVEEIKTLIHGFIYLDKYNKVHDTDPENDRK
ncbi:hypothetical protein QAD02_000769 [Eretmocerus hayati]|uniref:Uncharacterized protein n=1 Tax=Eretmocerus hayati TaxID=131215 RepID=A0ACC2NIY6_9HYME|nr:hypothetical protein QAD02_000769 [Eretmocerus hayati]